MNAKDAVERGLLEALCPVLHYHEQEPLRADSPAIMAAAAVPGGMGARLINAHGTVLASAAPGAGEQRLGLDFLGQAYGDPRRTRASDKDRILPPSSNWRRDAQAMRVQHPGYADRVYARAVQEGGTGPVWLQYWFFYSFNDAGFKGLGDHDGDWEHIGIRLDSKGEPVQAAFAQHAYGERRDYEHVETVDDDPHGAPKIYVALGSHASYFQRAGYRIKRLPGPSPVFDHATGTIAVWPTVERIDPAPGWVLWPGRWGRDGGPEGPAGRTQFARPERWSQSKSVDGRRTFRAGSTFLVAEVRPPEPRSLSARIADGAVEVQWVLEDLRPDAPGVPVRALVSVRRTDTTDPAITEVVAVTSPEGRVRLALPPGRGTIGASLTTFDAADNAGPMVTVEVTMPKRKPGARAVKIEPGSATPTPPTIQTGAAETTMRLLVDIGADDGPAASALRACVDEVLTVDGEGAPWRIEPLFPRSGGSLPARLRTYWTVTGRAPGSPTLTFSALAWDHARRLADATGYDVCPDLASAAFQEPEPLGPRRSAAGSAPRPPAAWALESLGLDQVSDLEPTLGAGVLIAQPDTGVTAHEAITAYDRERDHDVLDRDDDATDPLEHRWYWPVPNPGHGTSTASVILGPGPDAPLGAAPKATLIPIRTVSSVVQVFDGDVAVAVDHARRLGVDVITMSLGGDGFFGALREVIAQAVEEGIIVMAAGGNVVWWVTAPARFEECLAVAAIGRADEPWSKTSDGPEIDWSAPGHNVPVATASRERGEARFGTRAGSGSSFAVALSAAVAARWIALHGRDRLRERYGRPGIQWAFRAAVQSTVRTPDGWKTGQHGAGILDAAALLRADLPSMSAAKPPPRRGRPAAGRSASALAAAELAPMLKEVAVAEIPDRIAQRIGLPKTQLAAFAAELGHHLMADPELRGAIARPGRAAARAAEARARLAGRASTGLTAALRP